MIRRNRLERELHEELQYHLERQVQEYIARGLTADEARYAALKELGNTAATTEHLRELHGFTVLEAIVFTRRILYVRIPHICCGYPRCGRQADRRLCPLPRT